MDGSDLERLITQCKSSDVDARIDAVTKLQTAFESGIEISDTDTLVTVFKACLRHQNQHLTSATLSALPSLISLLTTRSNHQNSPQTASPTASTSSVSRSSSALDAYTVRQMLLAFLPAGGIIDKLGDKEKIRDKARQSLVLLGGMAFRCGSGSVLGKSRDKGPETPLMIFERLLRELGFGSKVWKVREQTLLTLVNIRRIHHLFPIRAYLPHLVETLEDNDSNVREIAKQSVVELFTGPGVTDAARADLKKEMSKKNVRKSIVEFILAKVLAGGGGLNSPVALSDAGSENGDVPSTAYVPPSIAIANKKPPPTTSSNGASKPSLAVASRPASRAALVSPLPTDSGVIGGSVGGSDVKPVYIASSRDLENEFAAMLKYFEGKETEHNWAAREKSIVRVRGMLKGDAHERFLETFLAGLKDGFLGASFKAAASLRTTVASHACSLYSELATSLGTALDPFCEQLYMHLIRMGSLTKKIIAQQSQATVTTIIVNTSAQPRIIVPLLWNTLQDKAIQTRVYAFGHMKTLLEVHATKSRHTFEAAGSVDILDKCLRKGLTDPNPGVRDISRQAFWTFESIWRDRGRAIFEVQDNVSKKALEKICPNPEALASSSAPTTPKPKKSSVAAAIAASRAKAKAIATAPPTLRHKATSGARSTTSPPANKSRATSPSLSSSTSGGSVRAISPISRVTSTGSPPRARIVSTGALSRSTSSGFIPQRETSRSKSPASPPSPTPDANSRRRISSPLVPSPSNSQSTFKRALQTALPASPPLSYSTLHPSPTPRPKLHDPAPLINRESLSIAGLHADEESLLLASNIPIPDDSDSEMDMDVDGDESINLISFSTPFEVYPPVAKSSGSFSPRSSSSKPGFSNALSTSTNSPPTGILPQPMVEDAMRARAEQAESAAQRLLELVEPDEDLAQTSTLPASLLLGTPEATPRVKTKTAVLGTKVTAVPPKTPVNRSAAILRKAALFQDSPAHNGSSTSVFDMIDSRNNQSDWWIRRMSVVDPIQVRNSGHRSDLRQELSSCIGRLEDGTADVQILKKLAILCKENPVNEPISPISPAFSDPSSPTPAFGASYSLPSLNSDLWTHDKTFDRQLNALTKFLDPSKSSEDLEYGLIVLWEMLENQAPLFEGREADVFSVLLRVRYCGHASVMQATTTFRDALTSRIEPVYGLTTMHACLRSFRDAPIPPSSSVDVRDGTFAFGLTTLGKFMLRLPAEVLEDELPRLRLTLSSALTDKSSDSSIVVREAAAASIIAAQLVIQDETHIFALLDGLPDDKKNLLAYLFDKHSSKDSGPPGQSAVDKLEKEIRRLDNRTSTPPRSVLAPSAFPPH
ncbi:CLASP family protein [Abortiporus biennis]